MENEKQGKLAPIFAEGYKCTTQGEKSEQRATIKALRRELEETRKVRDKALSFIIAKKEQKEFKQHIGLTCYPGYAQKVADLIREMLDLFCKQQEVDERYSDTPTAWHEGTVLPYSVVLHFSRLFGSEEDYLKIMGDLCTIREHLSKFFEFEDSPLHGDETHPIVTVTKSLNEVIGTLLFGNFSLHTIPTDRGTVVRLVNNQKRHKPINEMG